MWCLGAEAETKFCDEGNTGALSATLVGLDIVITVAGVQGAIASTCRDLLGMVEWARYMVRLSETVLRKSLRESEGLFVCRAWLTVLFVHHQRSGAPGGKGRDRNTPGNVPGHVSVQVCIDLFLVVVHEGSQRVAECGMTAGRWYIFMGGSDVAGGGRAGTLNAEDAKWLCVHRVGLSTVDSVRGKCMLVVVMVVVMVECSVQ